MTAPRRLSRGHREAIARGLRRHHERRREAARVLPADLKAAEETGTVRAELRPLVEGAGAWLVRWLEALGGEDRVSPQRAALLQSAAGLTPVESALRLRFLQKPDPDLATKLATVATARARLLEKAGLDRLEREVPTLAEHLERRAREREAQAAEDAPQVSRDGASEEAPDVGGEADRPAESDSGGRVKEDLTCRA